MAKKDSQKTDNPNIELETLTHQRTWRDFLENDAYMMFPEKNDWRQRFCFTLLTWATKEDSLEITDFALEMKMRRQTIYDWAKRHPDVMDALNQARLMIASRRKKGALTRKFDKDVVFKDLHKYDPEWLDINKYHSDMKKEEEKQAHTFIINDAKPPVMSKCQLSEQPKDEE